MVDQVFIFSFHSEYLKIAKQLNPNLSILHLFWVNPLEKNTFPANTIINRTLSASANYIGINWLAVTPKFLDKAHLRGLGVLVYTINEEKDMLMLIESGVDAIGSDYIDRLLKVAR